MEFNLGTVADRLDRAGLHPRLVGQIRKCKDLGSVGLDLEAAFDALQGLSQISAREAAATDRQDRSAYALAGRALFAEALIKYTRAFNSHDGRKVFSHNAGTLDQQLMHSRLMQLRNRGIAHYHPTGLEDASFIEDCIVVSFDSESDNIEFNYPFSRYNYREEDVKCLVELLFLSGIECDRQRKKAENELRDTLNMLRTDPVVTEFIEASRFDSVTFHKNAEAAKVVKEGGQAHFFHSSMLDAAND